LENRPVTDFVKKKKMEEKRKKKRKMRKKTMKKTKKRRILTFHNLLKHIINVQETKQNQISYSFSLRIN
jgi:hypothetical protein